MTHARFAQKQGSVPVWGGELIVHFDSRRRAGARSTAAIMPLRGDAAGARASLPTKRASPRSPTRARLRPDVDPERVHHARAEALHLPYVGDAPRGSPGASRSRSNDPTPPHAARDLRRRHRRQHPAPRRHARLRRRQRRRRVRRSPAARRSRSAAARYWLEDARAARRRRRPTAPPARSRLPGTEVQQQGPAIAGTRPATGAGAAVDAHASTSATAGTTSRKVHGRAGWDGKGKGVHATRALRQPLRQRVLRRQAAGLRRRRRRQRSRRSSGALDVVAHEFTHGVTAHTAKLGIEGQSGALNEAISDIFGCFVTGAQGEPHWQMGETIYHPNGRRAPLRDAGDPHSSITRRRCREYVDTTDDNGGVHLNSHHRLARGLPHDRRQGLGVDARRRRSGTARSRATSPRAPASPTPPTPPSRPRRTSAATTRRRCATAGSPSGVLSE